MQPKVLIGKLKNGIKMQACFEKIHYSEKSSFYYDVLECTDRIFDWHYHPEFELSAMITGYGKRFVGDNIELYNNNDLVLLAPNLPHCWYSMHKQIGKKTAKTIVIQFNPDFIGKAFFETPEFKKINSLLKKASVGVGFKENTKKLVIPKMKRMGGLNELNRLLELISILNILAESPDQYEISSKDFATSLKESDQNKFEIVFRYINENYSENISLSEVASLVHMSDSSFSRFFKKICGKTFIQYLIERKISRACELLIQTDLSITEIGYQSGFSNLSNFNRKFLEHKKINPTTFRKEFATK